MKKSRYAHLAIFVMAASFIAGCSEDSSNNNDTNPTTPDECSSDAQCITREDGKTSCDLDKKICVKPQDNPVTKECTTDDQCASRTDGKTKCDQTNAVCIKPQNSQTSSCGNNMLEIGEDCENGNLNGKSCASIGGYVAGNLKCNTDSCTFDTSDCVECTTDNTSLCDSGDICISGVCTKPQTQCGNSIVESGETCDKTNLNHKTCQSWPDAFVDGILACNNACEFDKSGCVECTDSNTTLCGKDRVCKKGHCVDPEHVITCGDGIVEDGEDCEDGKPLNLSCADFTGAGELKCQKCKYDTSNCVECTTDAHCANKGDKTKCASNTCVKPENVVVPKVVISQIYPGGGLTGSIYNTKYVELLNIDEAEADISGWSIQYGSSNSTKLTEKNVCILPNNTKIPKGGYYLVALSKLTEGSDIPTADHTCKNKLEPAKDKGKLFLVNQANALSSATPESGYVDAVGYGLSTNWSEGNHPTDSLSAKKAALRKNGGCIDTDNNGNDFESDTPSPRNSESPVNLCDGSVIPPDPICGNNKLDDGEDCDGSLFRGDKTSCESWNSKYNTGNVSCNKTTCKIDDSKCSYVPVCGNNKIDDGEDCDGTLFRDNKTSCESWNDKYNTGNVSCNKTTCKIDDSKCSYVPVVECKDGDVTCSEKDFALKKCVDGKWTLEKCPESKPYCYTGAEACTKPEIDDRCDIETFIPFVADGYVYDCNVIGRSDIGDATMIDDFGYMTYVFVRPCNGECKTAKSGYGVNISNAASCTTKGAVTVLSAKQPGSWSAYDDVYYSCCECKVTQNGELYWLSVPATYEWTELIFDMYTIKSCTPWPDEE